MILRRKLRRHEAPLSLAALGAILAYGVINAGGKLKQDWTLCLLGVAVLALIWWGGVGRERPPALPREVRWPLGLLLACAFLQVVPLPLVVVLVLSPARGEVHEALAGIVSGAGWVPITLGPEATLFQAVRIAGCVLVMLLARELTWRLGRRRWLAAAPIVAIAGVEAALGLTQHLLGGSQQGATGTYANHNHFAGLLEMSMPFALMAAVAATRELRPGHHPKTGVAFKACGLWGLGALIFVGIVCSFSRAGFVAGLVSLFVMAGLSLADRVRGGKRLLALLLVAGVLFAGFLLLTPDGFIVLYARAATLEGLVAEGRLLLWRETLPLIRSYPLLGCGLGTYESAFLRYKKSWPHVTDNYAHNDYLQGLAEFGVVGFLICATLIASIAVKVFRVAVRGGSPSRRLLALACLGSIAAILTHSLTDFNLYIPANAMLFAWVLGITAALNPEHRRASYRK